MKPGRPKSEPKSRNRAGKVFRTLLIVGGLVLSFLPFVLQHVQMAKTSSALGEALQESRDKEKPELEAVLRSAREWNTRLAQTGSGIDSPEAAAQSAQDGAEQTEAALPGYEEELSWMVGGVMGILNIPRIQAELPVCHGTDEQTLASGAGHLSWSSLPCGGMDSHALLSSHRGMASASLFTRLDELEEGDVFLIENPYETLAYRVCAIETVEPQETERLGVQKGRDLVTLITCTPYGLNTHRLLVTGERTEWNETLQEEVSQESQTIRMASPRQIFLDALPFLLVLLVLTGWMIRKRRSRC